MYEKRDKTFENSVIIIISQTFNIIHSYLMTLADCELGLELHYTNDVVNWLSALMFTISRNNASCSDVAMR